MVHTAILKRDSVMPRLRIYTGELRGRYIQTYRNRPYRPLPARLIEALFNRYRSRFKKSRVLDGFAGTGQVGIHALSEGAEFVSFIERDPKTAQEIKENLKRLGLQAKGEVFIGDIHRILRTPPSEPYDIIFLGPPFSYPARKILNLMTDLLKGWVTGNTLLLVQRPSRIAPLSHPRWEPLQDTLKAGDNVILAYHPTFNNDPIPSTGKG